jgi:hypothetical protein
MKASTFSLMALIIFIQCNSSLQTNEEIHVGNAQWKYGEGLNVGDWLTFDGERYSIRGDTIFKKDTAIAVVKEIKRGALGDDDKMQIQSFDGAQSGTYYSK